MLIVHLKSEVSEKNRFSEIFQRRDRKITNILLLVMGRSSHYKSPATLKRSTARQVKHLYMKIQMIRKIMYDRDNMDKSCYSINSLDDYSFCTSTPDRVPKTCLKCQKFCLKKHHIGIHIENKLVIGQAAPLLGTAGL